MATVTEPTRSTTMLPGELRMVIRDVGWHVETVTGCGPGATVCVSKPRDLQAHP